MQRHFPSAVLAIAIGCGLCFAAVGFASQSADQVVAEHGESQNAIAPDARIDINTASLDGLMKAPGMTRTWAVRIIRFRPYRSKNELLDKGVVPGQVYERFKEYIIAHRAKQ